MVDLKILADHYETSNEVLKRVFTRTQPDNYKDLEDEEKKAIDKDIESATKIKKTIESRLNDSIANSLKNHEIYMAVDLAWDSHILSKEVIPLTLYAQGKLNLGDCATSLSKAGFGKYVTKAPDGKVLDIDVPRFYRCAVNLIRSIMTRRLAAQSNKYANLWPYYKYEPRGTSLPDKLKSDLVSQRMDIMADQYDHRHHDVQVMRDMLMYATVFDFVRSSWEQEEQVRRVKSEPGLETSEKKYKMRIVKEGLCFVNPHPSRIGYDSCYPASSLNSDTGCEWVHYWDVNKYRDVQLNPAYWNRDKIGYSSATSGIFTTYSQYFTNYYCTIIPPKDPCPDLTSYNDRKNSIGVYGSDQADTAVVVSEFFWKLKPIEWGLGNYTQDVWIRFKVGGDSTIMFAELLPSSPCAVSSYNSNDSRLVNISFAMELMGFQDQLTNLLNHLLLCLQADHIKVLIVDKDLAEPEQIKVFRDSIRGQRENPGTVVLEISRSKLENLGIVDPGKVLQLVETRTMQIDVIFTAIGQLMNMVERMAALSPQEQGQPAPREISATEVNAIAGTTESVYGFISDSIDEARAAKKRIMFESWIVMGEANFKLPAKDRYPKTVIVNSGFTAEDGISDPGANGDVALYTVSGDTQALEHDMIFTSRDGAERPVNTQSANVLVQLLSQLLAMPQLANALTKEQLYGIVNEVFRQSGAGFDLNLDVQPGDDNKLGPDPNQIIKDIQGVLEGLAKSAENQKLEIDQIKQVLQAAMQGGPQGAPAPGAAPQPMPMPMAA